MAGMLAAMAARERAAMDFASDWRIWCMKAPDTMKLLLSYSEEGRAWLLEVCEFEWE